MLIPRPETEHVVEAALSLPARRARGRRRHGLGRDRAGAEGRAAGPRGVRDRRERRRAGRGAGERDAARARRRRSCTATCSPGSRSTRSSRTRPTSSRRDALMPEVARYEPPLALFGDVDGLAVIRRLVARRRAPFLALEHGEGQADAIEALARAAGFAEMERIRDLAGIERVVGGAAMTDGQARALGACVAARRRRGLPRRHGLRAGLRSRERGRGRQALRAQGPPAREAGGGDVLRPLPSSGATSARLLPGGVTLLLPNPERRFPLACTADPETLGLRVPFLAPVGPAGAAVEREPRRRPRRAAPRATCRRRSATAPTSCIDGGELARHALDRDRPAHARVEDRAPRRGVSSSG